MIEYKKLSSKYIQTRADREILRSTDPGLKIYVDTQVVGKWTQKAIIKTRTWGNLEVLKRTAPGLKIRMLSLWEMTNEQGGNFGAFRPIHTDYEFVSKWSKTNFCQNVWRFVHSKGNEWVYIQAESSASLFPGSASGVQNRNKHARENNKSGYQRLDRAAIHAPKIKWELGMKFCAGVGFHDDGTADDNYMYTDDGRVTETGRPKNKCGETNVDATPTETGEDSKQVIFIRGQRHQIQIQFWFMFVFPWSVLWNVFSAQLFL